MKRAAAAIALALGMGLAGHAAAGTYADDLGKCLVESATPKDNVALIQWMFSGISAAPAVKPMTTLTDAQRDEYNKGVAALFNRLLLQDCRGEAMKALKYEGATALTASFELLGKVAAATMMSDPAASAELGKFVNYIDMPSFNALITDAGLAPAGGAKK